MYNPLFSVLGEPFRPNAKILRNIYGRRTTTGLEADSIVRIPARVKCGHCLWAYEGHHGWP